MKIIKNNWEIIALYLIAFWVLPCLPMFSDNSNNIILLVLYLNPLVALIGGLVISYEKMSWLMIVGAGSVFATSMMTFYNESAAIYIAVYIAFSTIGFIISRVAKYISNKVQISTQMQFPVR